MVIKENRNMKQSYLTLNNGISIPDIGIGPGILRYSSRMQSLPKNVLLRLICKVLRKIYYVAVMERKYVQAVANSFKVGFRLLDYSSSYGDGRLIGKAIKKSKVPREQLFITTRISNIDQRNGTIRECLMKQLHNMQIDYVDILMFHWPVPEYYLQTWSEMVQLYREGYCKSIGVANCHQHHLEALMKASDVIPAVNQIEVHPLFTQKELIRYCQDKGITVEAYTAIARFDDRLMRLPLLRNIAAKYNKTVVQIVLRWHVQNGVVPIVRSLNKKRQLENISIHDFKLSNDEMKAIDSININSRLRYDPDNCDFSIL